MWLLLGLLLVLISWLLFLFLTTPKTESLQVGSCTKCPTEVCTENNQKYFNDPLCSNPQNDPNKGLGCGAFGIQDCRFCGFGSFSNINCGGGPAPPTPPPPEECPTCPEQPECPTCPTCPEQPECPTCPKCPTCEDEEQEEEEEHPPVHSNQHNFVIKNKSSQTLWIGAHATIGTLPGGGGWAMAPGSSETFKVGTGWNGRFWARTGCKFVNGVGPCDTGDCGNKLKCGNNTGKPPATLAEFNLDGSGGVDFYDVSLVDGSNVKVNVKPIVGTYTKRQGAKNDCGVAGCTGGIPINQGCPSELQIKDSSGSVVGCLSGCAYYSVKCGVDKAHGQPNSQTCQTADMYCCHGKYNCSIHNQNNCPTGTKPCNPATWPMDTADLFKQMCPKAYGYAYDDVINTFTCKSKGNGVKTSYVITFYD